MNLPLFKQSDGRPSASFTSGIYKITNTYNNKVYIGSSVNVVRRLRAHRNYLIANKHQNIHMQRAFNEYGGDAFVFEVVEIVEPNRLLIVEQQYLDLLWDDGVMCYNMARNAEASAKGIKRSSETKIKISESKKGNKNRLGKPNTPETRAKLSRSLKGRKTTEETRKKLSIAGKGRKATKETIEKRAKTYSFKMPNGEDIYIKNLKHFCQENNIDFRSMLRVYHGQRKSHKGWRKV